MAARQSIASGNWSAAGTWDTGVPIAGDTVTIGKSVAVTITAATDNFAATGHGFVSNEAVQVAAGTLPGNLARYTTYYVIYTDANNFKLSASAGPGAAVDVSSAGATVTVVARHEVTVDDTSRASAAITLHGILKASRTANCKLAYSATPTISATGHLDWGTTASPIPAAYTATLAPSSGVKILFNTSSYGGKMTVRGDDSRTSWTTVATASLSAPVVADATGWQIGDEILFVAASSTNNAANHIEVRTLSAGYTPGSTTLSLSSNLTYTHIAGGRVCNLTRNVILKPASGSAGGIDFRFDADVNAALSSYIRYARLEDMNNNGSTGVIMSVTVNSDTVTEYQANRVLDSIDHCVFYNVTTGAAPAFGLSQNTNYLPVGNCCFYDSTSQGRFLSLPRHAEFTDCTFATTQGLVVDVFSDTPAPLVATRCWFSAGGQYSSYFMYSGIDGIGATLTECIFSGWWRQIFPSGSRGTLVDVGSDWGYTYGIYLSFGFLANLGSAGEYTNITSTDSLFNATHVDTFNAKGMTGNRPASRVRLWNKNGDTALQEYYTPQCKFSRETTTVKNSPSSLKASKTTADDIAQSYTFQILAKNGETLQLRGYLNKNAAYGSSTRPSVTVSGLGVVAVAPSGSTTYTMTDVTDWELFNLYFSQSSGADGLLDVTFTVQSSSATAIAYLGGIAISPFVTRTRHYGYQVLETSPTVLVDSAIDPAISEATAAAYTGIGITWGSTSSIATSADTTFKKLVHYTSATMDTNVASALPITWAGAYASPAIFAQGAINISGDTLNGPGSIEMGAYTLTATLPWAYTYTGGTFAQATTVPTFSGGTLNIGAAGTFTYTQAAAMILSMTPTAPGTYALGATTFTGQVDLRNTAAHAITVELPTGTSYTTASNTGGTITVSLPVVTANISITSMPNDAAGTTRLQIINKTALTAASRANSTAYSTGAIRLRQTGIGSENTAGLYLRCTTAGTSAAAPPTWNTTVGGTTTDGTVVWTTYAVLYYDTDPAATSYATTYIDGKQFLAGETVEIRFAEMNGATSFKTYSTEAIVATTGFSALVAEEADSVFATFAIDGSTLEATFSPNFTSDYIVLDSNTDFSGKGAYAYYCYTLTTSAGMYNFWGGVTALDAGNIRINVSVLNLYFDESAGFVKQTDNVRIFRSDDARPAIDPTTGGHGIEINWRTPVSTTVSGSGVTAQDKVDIIDGVWSRVLPL